VNPAEVLKLAEKYFGSINRGPEVTKTVLPPVTITADRYVSFTDNYAKVPMLIKTYPTVPNYHPDMAALSCLSQVIGQGKNSVLYQQFVKTQTALQATAFSRLNELSGEFSIQLTPLPGKTLAAMDSLFKESLLSFEKRGVTDDDIQKFKGGIEAQYVNGLQSVSGKVSQLASFQTYTGNPNMIGKMLQMYRAVTKEDVMRVYNTYLKNKFCVTVSVLTKSKQVAAAMPDNYKIDSSNYKRPDYGYSGLAYTLGKDDFDRSKIPGNGANHIVKVPAFWKKDLPNGIKIIGSEITELPVATIQINIPGGHLAEAEDTSKIGVAKMTALMLGEDSKKYTAEQMAVELQKLGSSISVTSTVDGIRYTVQMLTKNIDKTLALLEEKMFHPNFTADAFTRLQKQALEGFKQTKSQPAAIANIVYEKISYGSNNILGLTDDGTENSIKNLSLADVQHYYDTYMTSRNTKVVIVGDLKQKDILPKLSFLDQLPDKKIDLPVPPTAMPVKKTTIYIVDVPKAAQTEFRVGKVTGLKYDATGDYYKAGLANYVLGGDFNGRVNINLREDKGWTYGARTSFTGDRYTGKFSFSSGIRADATDSALVEVLKELKNYASNGITQDEISFLKSSLGQRDALLYETGAQKAIFIGRILEYGLPADFVDTQNQILKNINKSELDAIAKKWLSTDDLNILLVGDKAKILQGLQKFGYDIVELDVEGNRK